MISIIEIIGILFVLFIIINIIYKIYEYILKDNKDKHSVMNNSVFESIGNSQNCVYENVNISSTDEFVPENFTYQHEEIMLNGIWKYIADPNEIGEKEKFYAKELNISLWKDMNIPSNYGREDESLANFTKPVWFGYTFKVPDTFKGKQVKVVFEGVDYFANVYLNGEKLGSHEGYFNPFQFDISDKLIWEGDNVIIVKVVSPIDPQIRDPMVSISPKTIIKGILNHHDCRPGALINAKLSQTRVTGGILGNVKIVATGEVRIESVFIIPTLANKHTEANITFQYHITNNLQNDKDVYIFTIVKGHDISNKYMFSLKATLKQGTNKLSSDLTIQNPILWWPWDHPELGNPYLYTANVYVVDEDKNSCFDNFTERFGIREINMGGKINVNSDKRVGEDAYHFYLNGKKIFIKGTSIIPSQWLSEIDAEFCNNLIKRLKEANINTVRIHAHITSQKLIEKFDEGGIMVLQDFPLQWRYDSSYETINKAKRMTVEMIHLLCNHPSIILWCNHNEPTWAYIGGFSWSKFFPIISDDKKLDDALFKITNEMDTKRPSHKASGYGDIHRYEGFYKGRFTDIYNYKDAFVSEFGIHSLPYSMQRWMQKKYLWPPKDNAKDIYPWSYHDILLKYIQTYIGAPKDYESFNEFAFASQIYQSEGIKYYIEHYRTTKYNPCGGILQFQFLNWWESSGFGVVDYDMNPLPSYMSMKNAFEPVHICAKWNNNVFESGENINFGVYAINDFHERFENVKVEWKIVEEKEGFIIRGKKRIYEVGMSDTITVYIGSENSILEVITGSKIVTLMKDSMVKIDDISISLPKIINGTNIRYYTLYLAMKIENKTLSENKYSFIIVPNKNRLNILYGITPRPFFDIDITIIDPYDTPVKDIDVQIKSEYSDFSLLGKTDNSGKCMFLKQKPDIYLISIRTENNEIKKTIELTQNTNIKFTSNASKNMSDKQ